MLCFLLWFFGTVWAFVGVIGWIMTALNFQYVETLEEFLYWLATILLLISGYFVWFGWLTCVRLERFPIFSVRKFWLVSLVHHICCIVYLIPMDVWGGGDDPFWIPMWIVGNALIAAYYSFRPNVLKEQVD